MSQNPSEKFLYFTVGLLKGSTALEALRQDATQYHMIDHPGQLIALRLTEYYELISQGTIKPVAHVPAVQSSPETETTEQTSSAETHVPEHSVPVSFPSPTTQPTNVQPPPAPVSIHSHTSSAGHSDSTSSLNQLTGKMRALRRDKETIVTVSSAAEQNADEAADYWSTL